MENTLLRINWCLRPLVLVLILISTSITADENLDTRENENITLKCRFSEQHEPDEKFFYYWARFTPPSKFENVAVSGTQLNTAYKVDFRPERGIYDLQIQNVQYSRDNGRFQCRIKAVGTGADVHQEYYNLTVLTPPQPPVVAPGAIASATENKKLDLTCSSIGGSPDPQIIWYREGSSTPIETTLNKGGSKDLPTTSTLSLVPRKEDDGVKYRCAVWNRAMSDGQRLETTVTLSVNYYPRVEVGPENPLRVERDTTAKLVCNVDAKPKVTNVRWTRNNRHISSSTEHIINRVSSSDSGKYTCAADNGLGQIGEQTIELDVLFPPIVVIESKTREAEERETVNIRCNVTSNPPPVAIEWLKEGSPDFRYSGDVLTLRDIRAEHAGTYLCRAVNMMKPYNGKISERVGNATVAVLVRHRPGQAYINPSKPVVHVGNPVTLTCSANPPGWPVPQFKWFKDPEGDVGAQTVLAQGSTYVIPRAHLGTEGKYHCHAANELGHGEMATIVLEVHQPPQFTNKLQGHMTRRVGDPNYTVACSAKGKPRPSIKWLKDNKELISDGNLFEIETSYDEGPNGMVTVKSNLKFAGKMRPAGNQLISGDRGIYSCLYENEVNIANSTMHLRIEHEPIILNQFNKVAYDIGETADVVCKVQAYPKPEFQWQFGTNTASLTSSSDGHHEIIQSTDNNDVYTSILRIHNLRSQDYGEYQCRVSNTMQTIRAHILLQPKGKPEQPLNLRAEDVGPNYVTLLWDPGFDGGLSNTKYFISYRKVPVPHDNQVAAGCDMMTTTSTEWSEFDCHRDVPCNVTPLDQHQSYVFKVKALNSKGSSKYSTEIATTTKVSKIPSAIHVTFDPDSHVLAVNVGATCLALIAVVESVVHDMAHQTPMWQIMETVPLAVDGRQQMNTEVKIDHIMSRKGHSKSLSGISKHEYEDFPLPLEHDLRDPQVRVKLCLKANQDHCGEYTDANIGVANLSQAGVLATPTLIAIVVSCIVFALVVGLILMFCRCKRNQTKKGMQSKDYEMDQRPSIVAQQNQAPPPYYPASGLDNKALEHSMDLALALEEQKNAVYAQNGYGYHTQGLPMNMPSQEWVSMGYMQENSYSNSNNGGSVNSQDSLWQLKMGGVNAGVNANSTQLIPTHNNYADRQPSYNSYDPLTHGGYRVVDDYAPYPTLQTPSSQVDDYHNMRNSQNPSRQDYSSSEPYAAVHKPKKRLDQHIADSPYHDVSGLPEQSYLEHPGMMSDHHSQLDVDPNKPMQHNNYDESIENEYAMSSNSRNRRVIHEIIV